MFVRTLENTNKRGTDMFKFAFILIIVVLVANICFFVKNFKEERAAVKEKMEEASSTANQKKVNATKNNKKNYSYKK